MEPSPVQRVMKKKKKRRRVKKKLKEWWYISHETCFTFEVIPSSVSADLDINIKSNITLVKCAVAIETTSPGLPTP